MRAITVEPKKPDSAKWEEVQEPDVREGSILVEAIAVGVCGTDVEIIEGKVRMGASRKDTIDSWPRIARPRRGSDGAAVSRRVIWLLVLFAAPTPCPAQTVPSVNGTCAATASTQNAVSKRRRLHVGTLADRARVRHEN